MWLVKLAPLSDPDLAPQAVASVLGIRETPGAALVDSLCVHLASREALLVLDNCEHLVGACASLVETLVRSCPRLRILATSREALGVRGETLFAVPPLSLPDPRRISAMESLGGYEAARLFVERARVVRPEFEITEQNAMAVAQICYRLDGIPLAIRAGGGQGEGAVSGADRQQDGRVFQVALGWRANGDAPPQDAQGDDGLEPRAAW